MHVHTRRAVLVVHRDAEGPAKLRGSRTALPQTVMTMHLQELRGRLAVAVVVAVALVAAVVVVAIVVVVDLVDGGVGGGGGPRSGLGL